MTLQNYALLEVICAPTGSDVHLEVADNAETPRLKRRVREKRHIAVLAVRSCDVAHAEHVVKHLDSCRRTVRVLTVIAVLDHHNAQCHGDIPRRKLLKVEAKIKILHLDLLTHDVVHLRALLHGCIKHRIAVRPVCQTDVSQLSHI